MTEPKKDPNEIARLLYAAEAQGEVQDCPKCGWQHRPLQKCRSVKWNADIARKAEAATGEAVDPLVKFQEWEARAKASPTTYTDTGRKCPGCGQTIWSAKNFLGKHFDVIGEKNEYLDDHQELCCKPVKPQDIEPELVRPDRPRRDLE